MWCVKKVRKYSNASTPPEVLRDVPGLGLGGNKDGAGDEAGNMVRTQIYLTRAEHGFIAAEAARRGEPMAAVIRGFIDEKMRLPDSAWEANPMLDPTPEDGALALAEDTAINHDHYLYGAPKKYVKKRGRWVLAGPREAK